MALGRQFLMRMFGRPKGILGWLGGVIMARVNRDAAAQVIELLNVRPDDKVLEVGFGPGVAIQLLLQRLPTGSVAGVDTSQEMVSQAAARNADGMAKEIPAFLRAEIGKDATDPTHEARDAITSRKE